MLMGKDEKQPFRSYEAMAAKWSQLVQDKKALEAQLEAPMPQVSALESSIGELYHQLYNSSNQLQLSSPVRKAPLLPWALLGTQSSLPSSLGAGRRPRCLSATEGGGLILAWSQKPSSEAMAGYRIKVILAVSHVCCSVLALGCLSQGVPASCLPSLDWEGLEVKAGWVVCFWGAELFHRYEENPLISPCSQEFGLCPLGDLQADAAIEHHAGRPLPKAVRAPE